MLAVLFLVFGTSGKFIINYSDYCIYLDLYISLCAIIKLIHFAFWKQLLYCGLHVSMYNVEQN